MKTIKCPTCGSELIELYHIAPGPKPYYCLNTNCKGHFALYKNGNLVKR